MRVPVGSLALLLLLTSACDPTPETTTFAETQSGGGLTTVDPVDDSSGVPTSSSGGADDMTTGASSEAGDSSASDPADDTTDGPAGETGDEPRPEPDSPPASTGASAGDGGDTGTTGDGEDLERVDVVLSIDTANGMSWPLDRLAAQVVVADDALRASGVDTRWYVLAWVDVVTPMDTLEGWGSDPDAYAARTALEWWADMAWSAQQPAPWATPDEDPGVGAGLDALAAVGVWDGWRPGAVRYAVHVTVTQFAEAPAVLSGYPVTANYDDTIDALQDADVAVLAWTPAGPGHDAPWGDLPSVADATGGQRRDIADESASPLDGPSGFGAALVSHLK